MQSPGIFLKAWRDKDKAPEDDKKAISCARAEACVPALSYDKVQPQMEEWIPAPFVSLPRLMEQTQFSLSDSSSRKLRNAVIMWSDVWGRKYLNCMTA